MALENLPPDELELRFARYQNVVSPCPFCGRPPLLTTACNVVERNDSPMVIYQAKLFCGYPCHTSIIENMCSRAEAQQEVIRKWNTRAPVLTDHALALVWQAAMTAACNQAIDVANQLNDDDCSSDVLEGLGEAIDKIKRWLQPDGEYLQQLRELIMPAPVPPAGELPQ